MKWALAFAFTFSRAPDPSLGADKVKHFFAAAAIQSVAYSLWREEGSRPIPARWRATAVTGAVSLGKEVFDKRQGRAFSVRDLVADGAGAGAATVAIIRLRSR